MALTKLTEGGASFEIGVRRVGERAGGIKQGTQEAGARLTQQWASVLDKIPHGGTDTGERVVMRSPNTTDNKKRDSAEAVESRATGNATLVCRSLG